MATSLGAADVVSDPVLAPGLVERVLAKLGLRNRPALDLPDLNSLFAAVCGSIAFDNIRKRIWFADTQTTPLPGGDPTDFFENWLAHGTGGTCWPFNGGMYALLHALGFAARRIVGSVLVEQYPAGANHGSVIVTLDGIDYLVDPNFGSFKVLPLVPGAPASTGTGIHDVQALPREKSFDILFRMGNNRERALTFRREPEHDPVDHAFWLARYDRTKIVGFFNDVLYVNRRFPDRILTLGRMNMTTVAADGTVAKTEITERERKAVLIEELGISQQMADVLPPDVSEGHAFL